MPDAKSADETRADALTYKLQRLSDYSEIPSTERLIDPYFPLGGQIVLAALPNSGNGVRKRSPGRREGVQARPHLDRWPDRTGKMFADEPVDHSGVAEVGLERSGLRGHLGTAAVDRDLRTGLAERRQTVHVRVAMPQERGTSRDRAIVVGAPFVQLRYSSSFWPRPVKSSWR